MQHTLSNCLLKKDVECSFTLLLCYLGLEPKQETGHCIGYSRIKGIEFPKKLGKFAQFQHF